MIRKAVFGAGVVSFVPIVSAASPIKETSEPIRPPPMKFSDLPIYDTPHADYAEHVEAQSEEKKPRYIRSALQAPVQLVRQQVQALWGQTESVTNAVKDNYHEFQDRTDWIVQYLREEENKEVRYGAVAMGGLTGFIFGLRGGIIRRVLYTTVGVTAMGAVCFPEETKSLAHSNGVLARQYVNIAYNFLYGVKPGDPQLEVKFPELSFPKSFSEFVDLAVSMTLSAKQAIMPPPGTDTTDTKPSEKKD